MRGRTITKEISVQELLELREEGYSNREIADLTEISYSTVCKYIGRGNTRKPRFCKATEPVKTEGMPQGAGILPCGEDKFFVASDRKRLAIRNGRTLDVYQMAEDGDHPIVTGLTKEQVGRWASELTEAWRLMA